MAEINWSDTFSNAGGAVSDLFGAVGSFQAAGSYRTSAKYARQNADLERESLAIKRLQLRRETFRAIGGQKMDVAASGFANSGTALDLARDTASQGALARNALEVQGKIDVNTYEGQAEAADQQAGAEETAGIGGLIGSVLQIGALVLPFLL